MIILCGIHVEMILTDTVIIMISGRGTIADPQPRVHLKWVLYAQMVMYIVQLVWGLVGMIWTTDPDINCRDSHALVLAIRIALLLNLFTMLCMAVYFLMKAGVYEICYDRIVGKWKHGSRGSSMTLTRQRLSLINIESRPQNVLRRWQLRIRSVFFWLSVKIYQKNVLALMATTLSNSFSHFRGYVHSDIAAGLTLLSLKGDKEKVCVYILVYKCLVFTT